MTVDLDKIKQQSKRTRQKRKKEAREKRKRNRLDNQIDDWHKQNVVPPILDLFHDFKWHIKFHETTDGTLIDPPEAPSEAYSEFEVSRKGKYDIERRVCSKIYMVISGYRHSITARTQSDYAKDGYRVRYWYDSEWHLYCRDEITDMLIEYYLPHATPESIDRFSQKTDWIS